VEASALSAEALSSRESEILSHLVGGGRVASIADKLFISRHTVRNHLRNIFWKLGVHSQAELIERVKASPEILGDRAAELGTEESKEILAAYTRGNQRLAKEIEHIQTGQWGPDGFRELMHTTIPTDDQAADEWRARLDFWSRERLEPALAAAREQQIGPWRERAVARIVRAQEEGWLRDQASPPELLEGLFSLIVGISLQLVKDPEQKTRDMQKRLLDLYLDSLIIERSSAED
jgi:DNA-binding CsgD family transcriptional regulator